VEALLREIEARLAATTAEQRAATATAFRGIVAATKGLADLQLSRKTVMAAVNLMVMGAAQGHSLQHHLRAARELAPKIGRHVDSLVSSL
jgi:hypothetical protein